MTTNTGGSAFPQAVATLASGMTMRDYFAAHASEADIAPHLLGPWKEHILTDYTGAKYIAGRTQTTLPQAQARYLFADDMLKARAL